MLTISQSENAILNIPVTLNAVPVNVSTATDIVVKFTGVTQQGQNVAAPIQYSLNPIPTYGDIVVNVNNISLDLTLETFQTAQFQPGTYTACIIVKTLDPSYSTGEKRTEYRTPNALRINAGCNTVDLMP